MIAFGCPRCRQQMQNPDSDGGHVVNCCRCGQAVTVPDTSAPLPALPPEPQPQRVRVTFGGSGDCIEMRILGLIVIVGLVWFIYALVTGTLYQPR